MILRQPILFFFLILCVAACNGSGERQGSGKVAGEDTNGKGRVIASIPCRNPTDLSYSLYLPKGGSEDRKYPLIIAFDPHGKGSLPLEKYKDLAGKYGYILMGSNDSKNGQDEATSIRIIAALMQEALRYPVDTTRIYAMGFSGGSRVASLAGFIQGGIAGVIGCGGGFPSTRRPVVFRPDYIGFAGNADFNMNEMIDLDARLEQAEYKHALILFNGRHEWPPETILENAFYWTGFCAMRNRIIPTDEPMIQSYIRLMRPAITEENRKGDIVAGHDLLLNLIRFIDGLTSTDSLKKELNTIENHSAYRAGLNRRKALAEQEMKEQETVQVNFFSKDLPWWKQKINDYETRIRKGKDSSDVRMCKRMMSYLSLVCYVNYTRMNSLSDTASAHHAMAIYERADPENAALTKSGKAE